MARTGLESGPHGRPAPADSGGRTSGRSRRWAIVLVSTAMAMSACGLHVSKHGVSGNVFGHSFSAAEGQLPAGFPSAVPVPDHSRVIAGGGAGDRWDVSFAVTGPVAAGTAAYQAKFRSAGYVLSNIRSGSTPGPGPSSGAPSGSTTTTLTFTGSVFTATDPQWTVEVVSGSTTSSGGPLKAGEFAVNITVVPTASTSPPST